jgi:hypothetical protein
LLALDDRRSAVALGADLNREPGQADVQLAEIIPDPDHPVSKRA